MINGKCNQSQIKIDQENKVRKTERRKMLGTKQNNKKPTESQASQKRRRGGNGKGRLAHVTKVLRRLSEPSQETIENKKN